MDTKLSAPQRPGFMLVVSSPSGAGKSTLCRALLERHRGIRLSVSVTTRAPRTGEVEGRDYFFVDQPRFDALVAQEALLEHAMVLQNFYGTPRAYVEDQRAKGYDVLFDIDWQGAQQLREGKGRDLVSVFILPPTVAALEARLKGRNQDSSAVVGYRLSKSVDEMSHWQEYDYVIINDDLDQAKAQLDAILLAERTRRERQVGLYSFVQMLGTQARSYSA